MKPTNQTGMAFPLEDERPRQERPPWEPKTRFEMERDMNHMRARDRRIGNSLGWIVDVLLQGGEAGDKDRLKKEKCEAIESLAYIRDVLISEAVELEEDRLADRLGQTKQQSVVGSAPPVGPSMVPPAPLPVIDSRPTGARQTEPLSTRMQALTTTGTKTPISRDSVLAPWNHTRSSFSASTPNLPRLLPPASRNLEQAGPRNQIPAREESGSYTDPLGAIIREHYL